jgi:hypothetical protein
MIRKMIADKLSAACGATEKCRRDETVDGAG